MIAVLVALLMMIVIGLPLVLAVDREARGAFLMAMALLYGSGAVFAVMLMLSIVHVKWTLVTVAVPLLVLAGAALVIARGAARAPARRAAEAAAPPEGKPASLLIDLITLLTLVGYVFFITLAPLWEWDFWAIWGLKARVFLELGTIDWRFLESVLNRFCHPDYPVLLPLNLDFIALISGGWSDRWLGILFAAWAIATILIVRACAQRETLPPIASAIALACTAIACSRYVGLAEGPLIAFGSVGVLMMRRAVLFDDRIALRHAAVMLGLAASTKNEGVALLAAVALVLAFLRPRLLSRLWPAVVIILPWMLLRAAHALPTDLASGPVLQRLAERLTQLGLIAGAVLRFLVDRWFWALVPLALLVSPAKARRREAFVLAVTALQLGFYLLSYVVTPNEVMWHVGTSWPRLTRQISIPLTYVLLLMLANFLAPGEDAPHAEARQQL